MQLWPHAKKLPGAQELVKHLRDNGIPMVSGHVIFNHNCTENHAILDMCGTADLEGPCGIPLPSPAQAVCTSSSYEAVEIKRAAHEDMFSCFQVVACGNDPEVKRGKPHPDLFLLGAKRLGLPPDECIVFEDAMYVSGLKTDLRGSR